MRPHSGGIVGMYFMPKKSRSDCMANLKNAGFKKVVPSLKASDLKGAEATVITVKSAEVVPNQNPGRGQRKNLLEIRSTEWPDRVFRPNQSGVSELISQLGEETDNWHGKKIPLVVEIATNPQTQEVGEVLHVAPSAQWKEVLADAKR